MIEHHPYIPLLAVGFVNVRKITDANAVKYF